MIIDNTPVEVYELHGKPVLVKREDLCAPFPGPSFSKIRGVVAHIRNRPESVIGVLDTYHSKAGWAVSYVCQALGKQCVDFWPRYKADEYQGGTPPRFQQQHARSLGATLVDLQAGRSAVLYHTAKKSLLQSHPGGYLMPNALKLPESITENAAEAERTCRSGYVPTHGTLVISVSSGTVAAGVLLGFERAGFLENYQVILHMGYSRSKEATIAYMEKVSGLQQLGARVTIVDEGYGYKDAVPKDFSVPFPCNPHYDAKAWKWLSDPINHAVSNFYGPVVFWNIGD